MAEPIWRAEGKIVEVKRSTVPLVHLVSVEYPGGRVVFDIHRRLNLFSKDDKVEISIWKDVPEIDKSRDYCGRGTVFHKKDGRKKLLISIGGYLVIIEDDKGEVSKLFSVGEDVYVRIRKK